MANQHDKNFRRRKMQLESNDSALYFISSILINFVAIAVFVGAYYYIVTQGLFPDWITYIYWGMKILVGYNIIAASARSLLAPILTAIVGLASFAAVYLDMISPISAADSWQLIGVSVIGLLIYIALG